jgi:hypothetical protein
VLKATVLRKIFGLEREEVTAEWRELHDDVYCMPIYC